MSEPLTVTTEDSVRTITLDTPENGNALDTEMLEALTDAFETADETDAVRAIILAGNGSVFVAGSDITEMKDLDPPAYIGYLDTFHTALTTVRTIDVPVIAAVDGAAYGGGNLLVHATDLAIAGESASFGQQEINLGIVGGSELVKDLPRKVVSEIVLFGDSISASRAHELGLVNRVVADDQVLGTATKWAVELAAKPQVAAAIGKRVIRAVEDGGGVAAETAETLGLSLCFATDDQTEGMEAFLENREPSFTDLIG